MRTSGSFCLPAWTAATWLAWAPTAAQVRHSRSIIRASRSVTGFLLRCRMNSSRLRTMPYLVKTRTSGLRFRTLSRTYPFRPLMTETTDTTVATPMITPRRVKNERSLLRRSAWNATAKTSERGTSARGAGLRALLLLLDLDLVPFFQGPNRLEGAGDDLLPVGEPPRDLDLQLARQAELDRQEPRLPVLQDVDARFGLDA